MYRSPLKKALPGQTVRPRKSPARLGSDGAAGMRHQRGRRWRQRNIASDSWRQQGAAGGCVVSAMYFAGVAGLAGRLLAAGCLCGRDRLRDVGRRLAVRNRAPPVGAGPVTAASAPRQGQWRNTIRLLDIGPVEAGRERFEGDDQRQKFLNRSGASSV